MSLLIITTIISVLVGLALFKYWQAKRTIEQVLKTNADLEQENQQQRVEIIQKNTEIKHAKIKQKNNDDVKRGNASAVDKQLQQHGWLRDDNSGNGVSGVQFDLSKPEGHRGNKTPDIGSQSDL